MRLIESEVKEERFAVGHRVQSSANAIGHAPQFVPFGPGRAYEVIKSLGETLHAGFPQNPVNVLRFADTPVKMLMASVQSNPITVRTKDICKEAHIRAWWLRESRHAQADRRSPREN